MLPVILANAAVAMKRAQFHRWISLPQFLQYYGTEKQCVPEYVQLQVQHQLAVTGKQVADVAVLLCGQQLEVQRIERDEDVIARLIVLEGLFWDVETYTPPPADGSEPAKLALCQLYPGGGATLDFSGDRKLSGLSAELVTRRRELEAKKSKADLLRQTLQ